MSDLALVLAKNDVNYGDLAIVNNDLAFVDGKEAILQHILQSLRMFFAEWFLDTGRGVPYFQQILVKNPDKPKIDALFIDVITGVPGVEQLNSYNFDADFTKRILSIKFSAATTSGVVDYAGLVTV